MLKGSDVNEQEFLASVKGWKVKVSSTGRRNFEHVTTKCVSMDLPAIVQDGFEARDVKENKALQPEFPTNPDVKSAMQAEATKVEFTQIELHEQIDGSGN